MPRDPFFVTRAAEIAANIGMSTLKDLGPGLFTKVDCDCQGDVHAELSTGVVLSFRWSVEDQTLKQVGRYDPFAHLRVIDVVLAA